MLYPCFVGADELSVYVIGRPGPGRVFIAMVHAVEHVDDDADGRQNLAVIRVVLGKFVLFRPLFHLLVIRPQLARRSALVSNRAERLIPVLTFALTALMPSSKNTNSSQFFEEL